MASSPEFQPDINYAQDSEMAADRLTSLTPADRDLTMTETINPGLEEIRRAFLPEIILHGLQELSAQIEQEGETVTRLELCTEFVGNNIIERLSDNAEVASLNWDLPAFAIWHTMYEGACDTLTEIQRIEESKETGIDGYMSQLIDDATKFSGETLSPDLIAGIRVLAEKHLRLFREDPTGFLLADDLVDESIQADQEEFYVEGVMLAAARYKEAYTIAQANGI